MVSLRPTDKRPEEGRRGEAQAPEATMEGGDSFGKEQIVLLNVQQWEHSADSLFGWCP